METFIKKCKKALIVLLASLVVIFGSLAVANGIQHDFGKINVTVGSFETTYKTMDGDTKTGNISYKLYQPKTATTTDKASALLLLHGYQNDHETSAGYAIEMARRGIVVLAIDEYGHGSTDISMVNRGYVNHKVTVNYGNDVEGKSFVEIGGQIRYKVLMNFSNLAFFNDKYTTDSDGNSILDSSMGGIAAYAYLSTLPYVDNTRMAVSGHSMGTWASWSVSAAYSGTDIEPRATILQAGELFTYDAYDSENIHFNNVLLITAKYDEFNYFRDYSKKTVDDSIIQSKLSCDFLGVREGAGTWNYTYGYFSEGSARRRQLCITNHRLVTHGHGSIKTAIEWLDKAIGTKTTLKSNQHTYGIKEALVLLATLTSIVSLLAMFFILLQVPFFANLNQSGVLIKRSEKVKIGKKWWKGAIITVLISALTYPFCTQLGHGLLPLPDTTVFRMTIGNGFLSWYSILCIIMLLTTIIPFIKARKIDKNSKDFVDLGLAKESHKDKLDWALLGKGALIAFLSVLWMYIICLIAEKAYMLDLRYIWPFFKSFTGERFVQFLVYIPIFALFFVLNNSKIFAQGRVHGTEEKGFKAFVSVWWKYALCMIGGIVLLMVIEYVPFFIGMGPGIDLLFSSTFGGPFMSLMIVFVPQVLVFSVICTYAYKKTGSIYSGAFIVAMLACWIVTGGSAIL